MITLTNNQSSLQSLTPYLVPPIAASIAIVPVFRDLIVKSALQKGLPVPSITYKEGVMGGFKAAPTIGAIVGAQIAVQKVVERALFSDSNAKEFSVTLISSGIVGVISAPVLAVFNGQTMGWGVKESLRKFSLKQGGAVSIQEAAFVAGLGIGDKLSDSMKERFGDKKIVDISASFISGALGSIAGYPANYSTYQMAKRP